jgi:XTP/dITP diphosphohydrolase|tara:strand:+ start:192 stop:794 length:603 start_codon:yes stop_codon:yes gene_type:complete
MSKKKILKLLIGSNNQGKIKEIRDLLPKNVLIYTPKDFNVESPKEIGRSFLENSLIKAKFFSKKIKMVCLADDSGLEIDVLNGAPGIYSARWGGKKNNFNLAINKVYKELKKIDENWFKKKITAKFICALTIYWPNNFEVNVIGKVEGTISKTKKGNNGFGYDPIFIPKNNRLTFGQMKPSKKYKIDHRMNAFNKIKKFF